MKDINEIKLKEITGGTNITGSLVDAITSLIGFVYDIGKSIGSSIRRISSDNLCSLK